MTEAKSENVVSIEVVHFVDRAIENERRLTKSEMDALKELVFERFRSNHEDTEKAFVELQRRLSELNHAHDNMVQDREKFLPREVHDQFYKEFSDWRGVMNTFRDNLTGKIAVLVGSVGIVLFLVLHYWR